MKKKIISLMMAAVLPVMMMAGCGSADNTPVSYTHLTLPTSDLV